MILPDGWAKDTLKSVAGIVMGQSPDSKYYSEEEVGLPFLQGCAEFQGHFPHPKLYCAEKKKIAPKGSILLSVRAPVGKLNIADRDYIIGRGLAAIHGTKVEQTYLEYVIRFEEPRLRAASQGSTFEAINSTELGAWLIEYPKSKPEQSKIAEILSTVDRAIEQTEALIAKQQRIKAGLMHDLLTRGIDEHGNLRSEATHQFKDSPLGRIPVEWEVKRLRDLAQINYGRDPSTILDPYGAYPVYGTADNGRFGTSYLYDGDSVILGRKGTIDRVKFANGRFWTIDTAYFLSNFSECLPKWLYIFCVH